MGARSVLKMTTEIFEVILFYLCVEHVKVLLFLLCVENVDLNI